jgi:Ca2+-binding EF-hand superfamily protein
MQNEIIIPDENTSLLDIIIWIESKFNDKEVDLNTFASILTECKQFKSKDNARNYFELLDADKNGSIDFSEFLAPILPELSSEDVLTLTKKSKITLKDLT